MHEFIDQYMLETIWSKQTSTDIIMDSIKDSIPRKLEMDIIKGICTVLCSFDEKVYSKLFSLVLVKGSKPIQAIAVQLGYSIGGSIHKGCKGPVQAFELGLTLIKECASSGLYELVQNDEGFWYIVSNYSLTKATRHELGKLQYLPPVQMIQLDWHYNQDGGFAYEKKNIILGKGFGRHDKPLAYDVVNKLQKVAWTIDTDTYLHEKDTNHNLNKKKFLRVMNEYLGKEFYFVWRYDSRGRMYSSGFDLNIQSNEYGKALLRLHNKEPITNLSNLYIAIANHAGKDKLTWQERINWTAQNLDTEIKWKEPMLGRKALRALDDAREGRPSGYIMSIDSTSSGYQMLAILSGCKDTALFTNCIDPTKRYDLYAEVTERMAVDLDSNIPREIAKKCVMRHGYNSTAEPKALLSKRELEVFYKVINGLMPGAEEVKEIVNSCWNEDADHHMWVMPDNHTVYVPVGTKEAIDIVHTDSELGEIPLRYFTQHCSKNYRSLLPKSNWVNA